MGSGLSFLVGLGKVAFAQLVSFFSRYPSYPHLGVCIQSKALVTSVFVSTQDPLRTHRCDWVTSWSHHLSVYSAENDMGKNSSHKRNAQKP